ncbi:hypothetical protein L1887_57883 [Cichorium endivia]|nr:hypothetical protein L1887_57883 [Cichorium endivia]
MVCPPALHLSSLQPPTKAHHPIHRRQVFQDKMSTQLLRGGNKDDLFEGEVKTPGQLPAQTYEFEDVLEHIHEALVEKRVSHNQAYRFKVLETIFSFFETARSQLLEAASQDFNGKAARVELELEYAFTLSQIAAALQSQCKPVVPGGALPDRFFSKLTIAGNAGGTDAHVPVTRPVGAVLVVAQPKRPFDDLFAPLVSAVAAGNVVCAVLTPTMPSLNKVIVDQLTPQLPKSAVFVISPADMPAAQHGVADLREAASGVFGVEVPGSSHVATRISVPGSAYVSASLATAPPSSLPLGLGGNASKVVAERLRDVATEVVEGASMLLGRGVGAPKYLFVHEETYGVFREALLLAIATSSANLAPRDDGSKLEEVLQIEQTIGRKVANCGGSARLQKPFASEKRPGPVALIEVDVEAARAAKLSAVISDRKVVAEIKDLAALVLIGVSSTEHAFGLIEELGLDRGHMSVYSHDSAELCAQAATQELGASPPSSAAGWQGVRRNKWASLAAGAVPKRQFDVLGCHSQHIAGIVGSVCLVERGTICSVEQLDEPAPAGSTKGAGSAPSQDQAAGQAFATHGFGADPARLLPAGALPILGKRTHVHTGRHQLRRFQALALGLDAICERLSPSSASQPHVLAAVLHASVAC